ncbi:hypothetical protein HIM_06430 [Hirsutella minnesotensis 3608]|uniref:Peptidase M43 pregnancy-associated plasma-A domain-containing protein n=1 Tax=Hirsutella minnesotensis 3608 TaxID=1043627 RepID=A0A0F8A4U7_9HYPO|nr:hypothetical protein HIM_06430 [Hirsutella minnesotensis 3608]
MVMLPAAIAAGLLASTSMAGPVAPPVEHNCATENVSPEIRSLWARQQSSQPDNGQDIELGAVFHFCCSSQSNCPTDDVANNGIKVMNEFYAPAKLKFNLRNTTRINDPICSQTDVTDTNTMDSLKAQSHQGGTDTLNIVYVPTNEGPGTKGVCIIPPPSNDIAASVGDKDGCVVALSTLPGQAKKGQGDPKDVTSVHEAGHWLGLQHTPETGGNNGGFSRRQYGGTRNIMEPVQITGEGIKYQFNQDQISSLRQIALMRKAQGNGQTGPSDKYPGGSAPTTSAAPAVPTAATPTTPAGNDDDGNGDNGGNPVPTYIIPTGTGRRPTGTGRRPTGTGRRPTGTGRRPSGTGRRPGGAGSNGGDRYGRPSNNQAPAPVTTAFPVTTAYPNAGGAAPATPAEAGPDGNEQQNGEGNGQQDSDGDCDDDDDSAAKGGNSSGGSGYGKRALDSAVEGQATKLVHIARRAFQLPASAAGKKSAQSAHMARANGVAV